MTLSSSESLGSEHRLDGFHCGKHVLNVLRGSPRRLRRGRIGREPKVHLF